MNLLTSLLNPSANLGRAVILHSSADYIPLSDIVNNSIAHKFNASHTLTFNADRFFDFAQITDVTSNGSLFDEHTFIRLNFGGKPNASQQKSLIQVLEQLDKNTFLLISCDKLTKTEQKSAWVKTVMTCGLILEIAESQVVTIVQDMFKWQNVTIAHDALNLLINQNQGNIAQLVQETKLLLLAIPNGQTVDINKIQELTTDNAQYNIYQLSKSYLSGNLDNSIKILNNLYQAPEDAILIAWVIHEDVKRLLKIKSKLRSQNNIQSIIRELGLWGESVQMLPVAEKRLSYNRLLSLYNDLATLDMSIKGVKGNDVGLHLTQIVKSFCLSS